MANQAGGPRYRLLGDHYINDMLLLGGTEVGDGTPYPFTDPDGRPVPPSQQMQPLNAAAEEEFGKVRNRVLNPVDSIPIGPPPVGAP
jgi:hypothetical protein